MNQVPFLNTPAALTRPEHAPSWRLTSNCSVSLVPLLTSSRVDFRAASDCHTTRSNSSGSGRDSALTTYTNTESTPRERVPRGKGRRCHLDGLGGSAHHPCET
ncbi:hypothetical protein Vafri_3767 [Volvox africanus]|uniref:Uncharacterized protein n=1 Tax=Volvox africanus TaxID=51714 RepID=A0A8J4EV59_9CHLO|nr:hypothetical protein Vafri_3767 [Volvox africanus]